MRASLLLAVVFGLASISTLAIAQEPGAKATKSKKRAAAQAATASSSTQKLEVQLETLIRERKFAQASEVQAQIDRARWQTELDELKQSLAASRQEQAKLQATVDGLRKELQDLRKQSGKKPAAPLAERKLRIIRLEHTLAADLGTRLSALFDDIRVTADARSNSLIVLCDEEQLDVITALAERLDEADPVKK